MGKQVTTEKDSIAKMRKDISAIREARASYERQWLVNVAFIYGMHHFSVDKKPRITSDDRVVWELREMERKNKNLRVSNYILPLFRSLLSRMLRMKTTITAEATTNDDDDKSAARVAREALEDFWKTCNANNQVNAEKFGVGMARVLYRKSIYQIGTGRSYLYPYFNSKTKIKAFLNDKVEDGVEAGAVEVKVFSPFNVFESYDGRKFYLRELVSIDYIKDAYGVDVQPIKSDEDNIEQQLSNILDGQGEEVEDGEKMAYLYTLIASPGKDYPGGRVVLFTDDKIISEEELPEECHDRLPVFKFNYLDFGFSRYPQGAVEQAISVQEDLNYTLKRIAEYKKLIAGKLLTPRGSKISAKWNDETGQIISYNQGFKPEYAQGINPPEYLFREVERCRRDMEDIMGVHDTSLGKAPSGVKSGVGIENLTELDDSQIAPIVIDDEAQISAFAEMVVSIMQKRYTVRRMTSIAGDNLRAEVNSFVSDDLFGNYRVKISLGSVLPLNLPERRNFILTMLKAGLVTPAQARELLEFGDVEGIFANIDEEQEKEEIQKMTRGQAVPDPVSGQDVWKGPFNVVAEPWEDHTIRLKVLHDFMKTANYSELPAQARAVIIAHEQQHQQFLSQEAQAAARMTGTPNPPPAPQKAMA